MLIFRSFQQDLHRWKVEEMNMILEDMKGIVQLRLEEVGRQRNLAERNRAREQLEWEQLQRWEEREREVSLQLKASLPFELEAMQLQETRDRIAFERLTSPVQVHDRPWQTRELEWTQKLVELGEKKAKLEEEHHKRLLGLSRELHLWELDLLANSWLKWQEDELQALDGDTLAPLRARWSSSKLIDKITANESTFMARSPYLDALLVFAGLFSGILSAFLIDIRKGLQEDLLLEILHQLQLNSQKPFHPTLVSIWVNGLWFSSLTASMMGALVVMIAKSLGRWVISKKEAIFHSPEYPRRRYREIKRIYVHFMFQQKLISLTNIASALIYIAVILFFTGLAVLLFTTQNNIGISFVVILSIIGAFILGAALHYFYVFYTYS